MSALDTQVGGDHYKKMPIQPMEYSMANKLDPCQHTIVKYVTRFRDKGGIEDLEKAKHVIDLLIGFEQGNYTHQKMAAALAELERLERDTSLPREVEAEAPAAEALDPKAEFKEVFARMLQDLLLPVPEALKPSKGTPPIGVELEWVKTCPCKKCGKARAKFGIPGDKVLERPHFELFKEIFRSLGHPTEIPVVVFEALREKCRGTVIEPGAVVDFTKIVELMKRAG